MRCSTDVSILHHYICSGQKWLKSQFRSIYSVLFLIQLYKQLGTVWLVRIMSRPTGLLLVPCTYDLIRLEPFKILEIEGEM
jgi:hypothetical protein